MIVLHEGFYAINGVRVIVDKGLVLSAPDSVTTETFNSVLELDAAYPEQTPVEV